MSQLARFAPGLQHLLGYRREWLSHDVVAGISVAAVAIPTAIAYAQIIGFEPVVGLYAAILPLVAYAIFGTSRHLIANPDAATCALIATTLTPLAAGDPAMLVSLSVMLALFTGLLCIGAGLLRLGFVADFLSQPILVGFLNGVAIHIFLGQIGKVFGFPLQGHGIIPSLLEFIGKLPETHAPTLVVGGLTLALLLALRRFFPRIPAPLIAVIVGVALVQILKLDAQGVAVVGDVPGGLPPLRWPVFDPALLPALLGGALGVTLLSFSNAMVVARGFAAKGKYEVDADRELFALGAAQIAAAMSQGFAISGTESRTAMNYSMGGRSQMAGLIAAAIMTIVLLFLTAPLASLPKAVLGAILIQAAIGLFDVEELRHLWRVSWRELAVALVTTLGVVAFGVLDGIFIAVILSILFLLAQVSRPPDAELGRVPGLKGFHNIARYQQATTQPGLVFFRFGSGLVFFNAPYFKKRALAVVAGRPDARWLVIDGGPINVIDATGASVLADLAGELRERGVTLKLAILRTEVRAVLERAGVADIVGLDSFFPTLNSAVRAFDAQQGREVGARKADRIAAPPVPRLKGQ